MSRREAFARLVAEVRVDGIDPTGAWTKSSEDLPDADAVRPVRPSGSSNDAPYRHVPPLQRDPCNLECLAHEEHVYVACFDEPTMIADRDHHPDDPKRNYAVLHYVGWTTQQPPVKRLAQHGAACRRSVVLLVPGSQGDEHWLKARGRCPRCSGTLWYYLAENVDHGKSSRPRSR